MTPKCFDSICYQNLRLIHLFSNGAERTADAPQLPVLSIIIERARPTAMTLAAVRVAIIPLLVVEVEVDPLLLGVVFIGVHPLERQRITAADQIVDADGVVVDAPLGVTTVRVSALAAVPLPPDVVVAVVFERTNEDRRAPTASSAATREVLDEADVDKANAGFGVAREDAGRESGTAVDDESGCWIRGVNPGNGVGEGLDCKILRAGRQRVGEVEGCEKQHDGDVDLHGGARSVSLCVGFDGE